jgi:hypothetical protein
LAIDNKISTPISVDSRGVSAVIDEDIDGVKAIPHVLVTKDESGKFVYASLGGSSSVTSDEITDATDVGKAVITAADASTARSAIGAGTGNSNLTLGTTGTTALAGNGTAVAATKIATARSIALTGPVTGSVNFDGSANVSIPTTLIAASTSTVGGVKQASDQANSTAPDVATLVTDFNALLAKLKTAGIMA